MKTTIKYTTFNRDDQNDKMQLYKMTSARESAKVSDLAGQTITMDDYVIFDREADDGTQTTVMMFLYNGNMYGTISRSFIDVFENFIGSGFDPKFAKTVKIGSATSKKGRTFLTAEIV